MLDLLMKRRSIRKYTEKPVDDEMIQRIIEAALLAPSSKKTQPWEFIVVKEKQLLGQLSQSRDVGATFMKEAPLAIVVLADPEKSSVWVEDTSIAATLIQLEAESLGLGSCWVQVRNRYADETKTTEEYIRHLLDIPDNRKVACMIAIGHPAETKKPASLKDLPISKVFVDKYGIGQ